MKFTIATRGSKLAVYQAHFVQSLLQEKYHQHEWDVRTFTTTGDRILDRPLSEFGGKGVFLKEIEEALLRSDADLAVHSLKDVPAAETTGLQLAAFLPREDPRDVWVSEQDDLMHLPAGKTVGTSSLRRALQVRLYRRDLRIELLRGNLDTRLRKLREGHYDAIIVAAAGLHRLQLFDSSHMHYLLEDGFIPAVGQGILVIQMRSASPELLSIVTSLNEPLSETAARIERGFLSHYEGGCHLPIGAFASLKEDRWTFRAFIGGVRTHRMVRDFVVDANPESCAIRMHEALELQGAGELLAELS